jgi:hypothetical protein
LASKAFVFPVISRKDYNAFRRDVGPNLADTYDQWSNRFANDLAEAEKRGYAVVDVEIKYGELIEYCRINRRNPDPQTLLDFTNYKRAEREALLAT